MAQSKRKGTQPQGSNMKPFYILLAAIVVLGGGFIAWSMVKGSSTATQPVDMQFANAAEMLQKADGIKRGPDSARVKVLVFADFTCPACKQHALQFGPVMHDSLLSTGKVQEVYYDFPLGGTGEHRHSFLAARAGRCANEQGKFWEYHDILFTRQTEWAYGAAQPTDQLLSYGTQAGLEPKQFASCVRSDKYADAVTASQQLGQQLGVGSTPTIIINGRIPVWRTWNDLKDVIKRDAGL